MSLDERLERRGFFARPSHDEPFICSATDSCVEVDGEVTVLYDDGTTKRFIVHTDVSQRAD